MNICNNTCAGWDHKVFAENAEPSKSNKDENKKRHKQKEGDVSSTSRPSNLFEKIRGVMPGSSDKTTQCWTSQFAVIKQTSTSPWQIVKQ
ncbi:hypothetical protein Q5P01_010240 [Channa striata]|uniref:Uncharacterized protein n=1 Tax=Channa striata TaxID=64152 RepID=A0AA88SVE7_CHASR|nr:hypothetical protein Q5P01_010240 [Channa striata]